MLTVHISDPGSAPALLVLRALVCTLAAPVIWWSFRGAREMALGQFSPPSIYLSTVFWFAVASLSFQLSWYFGAPQLWRFFSLSLLVVALGLASYGHRRGNALKARQFYRLYDHLSEAQAIADLAALDPDIADKIAAECRTLTAAALVARRG